VIGTASPNNHEYLRSLGAEATTYGDGLVERVRELSPDGIDPPSTPRVAVRSLRSSSWRLVLSTSSRSLITLAPRKPVRSSGGMGTDRAVHALKEIGELIEAGRLSLPVAQTFSLDRVGDAHELSATGHVRGKVVLLVG
jgi:NADPH:quinone reductase-like Zn-dependent oxidoreductase